MKKIIVLLLVLVLAVSTSFAALIQIGPTARFSGDITNLEEYKDVTNYDFGADARVNLGPLGVAANVLFGKENDNQLVFNSIITANLRLDLSIVDFSIGAGYSLPIVYDKETGNITVDGQPIDKTLDVFKESQLLARASVGVNLGGLGVSADYKIPFDTVVSYVTGEEKDLKSFEKGNVAISMLINLF